jgi:sugar lactone lactonase YvrE
VFDRNGAFLSSWGSNAFTDPHGISITNDVVYVTDRNDHVALKFTLDGKPLMVLGKRGQPSDTGATKDIELPPRSAGPFNKPTEMVVAPSGDLYVSDGYRNSRVHRFSSEGSLLSSWGNPGKEQPVFTAEGKFVSQWRDIHRPTDIYISPDDIAYVSEIRPSVSVLEKTGKVLARFDSPSGHGLWVDSVGDIYLASNSGRSLTKYIRKR